MRGRGDIPLLRSGDAEPCPGVVVYAPRPIRRRLAVHTGIDACVTVGSAYEAAAELLAGPVAALVIDPAVITESNRRLLGIARQRGVEVLAVGAMPANFDAEAFSGVRLVSRIDLPETIRRLVVFDSPPADDDELPADMMSNLMDDDVVEESEPPAAMETDESHLLQESSVPLVDQADDDGPLLTPEEIAALRGRFS